MCALSLHAPYRHGSVSKVVFLAALLVVAILRAMVTEERWQELVDALQETRQQVVNLQGQAAASAAEVVNLQSQAAATAAARAVSTNSASSGPVRNICNACTTISTKATRGAEASSAKQGA